MENFEDKVAPERLSEEKINKMQKNVYESTLQKCKEMETGWSEEKWEDVLQRYFENHFSIEEGREHFTLTALNEAGEEVTRHIPTRKNITVEESRIDTEQYLTDTITAYLKHKWEMGEK